MCFHVLQKQGFLTLQGRMRSEDSHTCRCLPNFSVPQLELPRPFVLPQDVWPEIWPFLAGRLLDWRLD